MDRQTKKLLDNLYKQQKQAKKNFNYYELNEINKKIYAINEQEEKERKKQIAIDRDNRIAQRIEKHITQKEFEL